MIWPAASGPETPAPPTSATGLNIGVSYGPTGTFSGPVSMNGRSPVSWPHRVGVIPPLAPGRLDRPADQSLDTAVAAQVDPFVVCQLLVGLGGVGKTQLAASLAERWWREQRIDLLVWVTATSRTSVQTRYAQAADEITGVDSIDPQRGAERFLAWLSETGLRWLLILDDLTDPADVTGLWPPITASGRTVVTTRRRDSALLDGRDVIDVEVFTADEAMTYLRRKLGYDLHRLDEAEALAVDLGRLPLALAQAATYIIDQDLTCAGYRRRLTRRRLSTLVPQVLPDDQRTAVANTWALSIDIADAATGGIAGPLLQLAALLDPNGIPQSLFTARAITGYCAQRIGQRIDDEDTRDAIRALRRLSLVTTAKADDRAGSVGDHRDTDTDVVQVHALLQRAVREVVPDGHQAELAIAGADALLEVWPEIERDAAHAQLLRANGTALRNVADEALWSGHGPHHMLYRIGRSFGNTGQLPAAVDYFADLNATAIDRLGAEHPDSLTTTNDLAYWRGKAGDPAAAVTALEHLLAMRHSVHGAEHPDTFIARHNLAIWRGAAGHPADAARELETLLADQANVLGSDHADTLATRHSLGQWRGEAGDAVGATRILEQLLADYRRIYGAESPHTLAVSFDLARWCGEAGDPAGAVAALQNLVDQRLRVLGADHPDTLTTRFHLARWLGRAGHATASVTAMRDLVHDQLRVLGPSHPDTLTTRSYFAYALGRAGDPGSAVADFERVLPDQLRILGPDHPDTLITRGNLAQWRGFAGDATGAVADLRSLLADKLRVLGPDHPHTLATRGMLARWLGEAESPAAAVATLLALVADYQQLLGPDNPLTRTAANDLAHWQGVATTRPTERG